jgi:ubiquinone/menaquinone biosynthesis C-methylase UbiE
MGFYDERILPRLLNCACGLQVAQELRRKVVPQASGPVLEVGMGSALNVPFYDPAKVEMVWGLEPSAGMRALAEKNLRGAPFEVRWLDLPGEQIPLEDASVDTVLTTFTLCTIPDWRGALAQMRRVLKPGGRLLFCEHGAAPDASIRRWQDRITPHWKKWGGGCHLNRPIDEYIRAAGFQIDELERSYAPGSPRLVGFHYIGSARP